MDEEIKTMKEQWEMEGMTQEEKVFMYFNVYLQGGQVPPELQAEFAEFELANTGLPKEPISGDLVK